MKKYHLAIIAMAFLLAGCEDRFRYPCQDPRNWEKEECKPPLCTVTQTCPEMLIRKEDLK